jgi:hypothetical protein
MTRRAWPRDRSRRGDCSKRARKKAPRREVSRRLRFHTRVVLLRCPVCCICTRCPIRCSFNRPFGASRSFVRQESRHLQSTMILSATWSMSCERIRAHRVLMVSTLLAELYRPLHCAACRGKTALAARPCQILARGSSGCDAIGEGRRHELCELHRC